MRARKNAFAVSAVLAALVAASLGAACGPNQRIINSAQQPDTTSTAAAPPIRTLQDDLQAMRNAGFFFIHVFRRKDGAEFDVEDRKILAENMPGEINRRTIAEDGRALVTGSNFRLPPENMKTLRERFVVEDYSQPGYDPANGDTNKGPEN